MPHEILDIDAIFDMDNGEVRQQANFHIAMMARDCNDRSSDDRVRKITLEIEFKPVVDKTGPRNEAEVQVKFSSKVPGHLSRTLSTLIRRDGKLAYNPDSPRNAAQTTMFPGDEPEEDDDR